MENVDLTDVLFRALLNSEGLWVMLLSHKSESWKATICYIIFGMGLVLCSTSLLCFHEAFWKAIYYQSILVLLSAFIFGIIYNYFRMEEGKIGLSKYEKYRIRREITHGIEESLKENQRKEK